MKAEDAARGVALPNKGGADDWCASARLPAALRPAAVCWLLVTSSAASILTDARACGNAARQACRRCL